MTTEPEILPESEIPPSPFEWTASYTAGLIGLSVGVGFYGLLFILLLIAWGVSAPNAPTATEGMGIYCATMAHLFPLCLWVIYRKQISSLPKLWRWLMAVGAWLLIVATLTTMAISFGL
jgi:hypothetical protein